MSRALRIEYEGAWYHIMNRGAGRQIIFHNEAHYNLFLKLLSEIHNRYRIEIHAYCLMNNHYHLLIRTPLANLSRAMRHINGVYTQRYNALQKTDGPLFRGRFKSIVIDSENYLLRLSSYIHLNPVAGKIVKEPDKYQWSSYSAYLNPRIRPLWLYVNDILDRFGDNMKVQKYRMFINEGIDNELSAFFKKIKRLPILGSDAFVKTISEKFLKNKNLLPEISEQKRLKKFLDIDSIMQVVADYYQTEVPLLKKVVRKKGNRPRQVAIYLACKLSSHKHQTIAEHFSQITYAGVAKIYQRLGTKLQSDHMLAEEIFRLEMKLKI